MISDESVIIIAVEHAHELWFSAFAPSYFLFNFGSFLFQRLEWYVNLIAFKIVELNIDEGCWVSVSLFISLSLSVYDDWTHQLCVCFFCCCMCTCSVRKCSHIFSQFVAQWHEWPSKIQCTQMAPLDVLTHTKQIKQTSIGKFAIVSTRSIDSYCESQKNKNDDGDVART